MTAPTVSRPRAPLPDDRWQARAACDLRRQSLDLTDIDDDSHPDDIAAAKRLCRGCPVLQECRAVAIAGTDYAGVAAAMTPGERTAYRRARGIKVRVITPADVIRDVELASEWTTSNRIQKLPAQFVSQVRLLTKAGMTAREIAAELADKVPSAFDADGQPAAFATVTVKTVAYARALAAGTRRRSDM